MMAIIQFIRCKSLWIDESYLALNLIHRSFAGLFLPLDLKQVAPILFLQISKFNMLLMPADYALRLFPLLSFLATGLLLIPLSIRLFRSTYARMVFLCLILLNFNTIYYANELKQYMSDVLVMVTLLYLSLRDYRNPRNRNIALGITLAIATFLSNVTPIAMVTLFVYELLQRKKRPMKEYAYFICGGIAFAINFFFFIYNHPSRQGMIDEWALYNGFMPHNPFSAAGWLFLKEKYNVILLAMFRWPARLNYLIAALCLSGTYALVRQKKMAILAIAVAPVCMHLFLSSFKMYPVGLRLMLYTLPSIALLMASGFDWWVSLLDRLVNTERFSRYAVVITLFSLYWLRGNVPIIGTQLRQTLHTLNDYLHNDDKIYVSCFSGSPFSYYTLTDKSLQHLSPIATVGRNTVYFDAAEGWSPDTVAFAGDVQQMHGNTWVLFTQDADDPKKRQFFLRYCQRNGIAIDDRTEKAGSAAYHVQFP